MSDDFMESDDFASEDFVSVGLADGEVGDVEAPLLLLVSIVPEPLVEPVAEPLADGADEELPLADGADEELPLCDFEVSVLVSLPVAEGDELLPDPLGPCASAGAATNARVTASANAPVNVFITLPPAAVGC
jgi:hypothetical protein